jgi:uncharacterized protein with PIN domain
VNPFTVRLQFHGDLGFFLNRRRHPEILERTLAEKTSIKDVIEASGVPHPEVDLILVNGRLADFDYVVESDAEIEVFPVGEQYTQWKEQRLQVSLITIFVVDGHLGGLARNLRLLGFDAAYDPQAHDRQLLDRMKSENRALLTRDRRLLMHAIVRHGYCPRSQNPDEQTIEVIRRFHLIRSITPFTRCLRCNALLEKVAKDDIIERLQPLTKIYYQQFRRCTGCAQIYWAGSHFSKLQKRLDAICTRSVAR